MNALFVPIKISQTRKLLSFCVQIILLVAILSYSWLVQTTGDNSKKSKTLSSQNVEVTLSQDCITSASITDFLFDASVDSNLFSNFSIDLFSRKAFNCVAFFVNGYARNPFYTFITTNAP